MASVNKVIIIGHLGRDPEMRSFPNGDQSASISVATTDKWKDKQTGEVREATEWHRIVFAGRLAEIAGKYLHKGSQVYVEGSLRTRKWTDRDGADRYVTEIRADEMRLLSGRPDGDDHQGQQAAPRQNTQQGARQAPPARNRDTQADEARRQAPPPRPSSGFDDMDDDIPF